MVCASYPTGERWTDLISIVFRPSVKMQAQLQKVSNQLPGKAEMNLWPEGRPKGSRSPQANLKKEKGGAARARVEAALL